MVCQQLYLLVNCVSVYNLLLDSHSGTVVMNVDISHRREKGASKDLPWAKFRNCPDHSCGWISSQGVLNCSLPAWIKSCELWQAQQLLFSMSGLQ